MTLLLGVPGLFVTCVLLAGYVEQFDTLLPELTVAEMLLYTAELKCPVSVSPLLILNVSCLLKLCPY